MKINENILVEEFIKYDSCIFMYSRSKNSINDILQDVIKYYNIIPDKIRSNKSKITYFEIEINENLYICVQDPNKQETN